MTDWRARLLVAMSKESHYAQLAERAFNRARIKDAERFARLADQWAVRVEEARRRLRERSQRAQRRLIKRAGGAPPRPRPEEMEDEEWEFGFEWTGTGGRGHKHDRTSDIDVNFHVRRTDGKPFTKTQAEEVMREFMRSRRLPHGYKMAMVDWRSPWKSFPRWKHGDFTKDILRSELVNVLETVAMMPHAWRLGNPKWED